VASKVLNPHRASVDSFDELRNHLQARSRRSRNIPNNARRHRFLTRGIIALRIMEAA
jgi:hypothetical protein